MLQVMHFFFEKGNYILIHLFLTVRLIFCNVNSLILNIQHEISKISVYIYDVHICVQLYIYLSLIQARNDSMIFFRIARFWYNLLIYLLKILNDTIMNTVWLIYGNCFRCVQGFHCAESLLKIFSLLTLRISTKSFGTAACPRKVKMLMWAF